MGNGCRKPSDNKCVPTMQRLSYDLTPLHQIQVPIIWVVGPPGSNRSAFAYLLEEHHSFDVISIADLLLKNASNETDRGRVIKENICTSGGYIPDTIVIDLLKEELLGKIQWTCGYIIKGFPKNKKQASLFVNEIRDVTVILHFDCKTKVLIDRLQILDPDANVVQLRDKILAYRLQLSRALKLFDNKVEKINAAIDREEAISKIESALSVRVFYSP